MPRRLRLHPARVVRSHGLRRGVGILRVRGPVAVVGGPGRLDIGFEGAVRLLDVEGAVRVFAEQGHLRPRHETRQAAPDGNIDHPEQIQRSLRGKTAGVLRALCFGHGDFCRGLVQPVLCGLLLAPLTFLGTPFPFVVGVTRVTVDPRLSCLGLLLAQDFEDK